jgi:hypothetical protein
MPDEGQAGQQQQGQGPTLKDYLERIIANQNQQGEQIRVLQNARAEQQQREQIQRAAEAEREAPTQRARANAMLRAELNGEDPLSVFDAVSQRVANQVLARVEEQRAQRSCGDGREP